MSAFLSGFVAAAVEDAHTAYEDDGHETCTGQRDSVSLCEKRTEGFYEAASDKEHNLKSPEGYIVTYIGKECLMIW